MSTLVKTYNFDSESWVYTANGDGSGSWQSSGGNTGGCCAINCYGRSNLEQGYLELYTTWEVLGVPVSSIVNQIDESSLDWLCDIFNVADGYTIGALEVRDSGGNLQATLKSSQSGSGTTSYASYSNASPVSIPAAIQESDSNIRIRLNFVLDTGKNNSAEVNLLVDNISLTIDYSAGATDIIGEDLIQLQTLSTGIVSQSHEINGYSLTHEQSLNAGIISQTHEIEGLNLSQSQTLDTGEIEIIETIDIVGNDLSQSQSLETGNISQTHLIVGVELFQVQSTSTGEIVQTHAIQGSDLNQSQDLTVGDISQTHIIEGDNLEQSQSLSTGEISEIETIDIIGEDLTQSQELNTGVISQTHEIIGFNLNQSQSIQSGVIEQTHAIIGQNLTQRQSLDGGEIIQQHEIIGSNLEQGQSIESGLIYQIHTVSGEDLFQTQTLSGDFEVVNISFKAFNHNVITRTNCNRCSKFSTFVDREVSVKVKLNRKRPCQ